MKFYTIRLYLKSFNCIILNNLISKLKKSAEKFNVKFKGPAFLPNKREIFNILRSPHVNKNSRDQLCILTHKRIIDFFVSDKNFVLVLREDVYFFSLDFNFKIII